MNQHDPVIFNGQKFSIDNFNSSNAFRAMMYGDGLFESILIDKKHIFLLDLHLERLKRGMNALKLPLNSLLTPERIIEDVTKLLNDLPDTQHTYRLRIVVWRSGKGKYSPEDQYQTNYLLSLEESESFHLGTIKNIGFSDTVTIHPNPLSNFKTLNGLAYVLAAMEKDEHNLDEMLLLNNRNEVVEGTSSNVFFVKNGILMTPKLGSGCLDGVMRNYLIGAFKESNIKVMLTNISPEEAKSAEIMFFCNSFSLRFKTPGNNASGWINKVESLISQMPKQPLPL